MEVGLAGQSAQKRVQPAATDVHKRAWGIKSEYDILRFMAMRSCRVTIQDLDGVAHTVEVTASTLYEAVAQGLAAIRGREWVAGVAEERHVKVSVTDVRVEHEVKLGDFTKWVERKGGSPRDVIQRQKVREILGMGVGR
jgi:hypothetical protein